MVLTTTDSERIRTLTIDRPESLNAMTNEVYSAIAGALAGAATDSGVSVVVITGTGRAFSAGQDLHEMLSVDKADTEPQFPAMIEQLACFPKPLIAAVNGIGVGIGMTILGHCDLVLMEQNARLRTPFPQLGLAPEAGSSWTFPTIMGWQNAAHVLLTGRWFTATECHQLGLVWKLCDGVEELMSQTMVVASEIAANPVTSLVATKQLMLEAGRTEQVRAANSRELAAFVPLVGAPANREAIAAFEEKRAPDFSSVD